MGGWGWVGMGGACSAVHHIQKYPGVRSQLTFTTAQEPTKVQCTNLKKKKGKEKKIVIKNKKKIVNTAQ